MALTVSTGLRRCEVLGLTWDRVDLVAGTLTVDRQLDADGRRLAPVKTRNSERVIPLGAAAVRALEALRDDYPTVPVDLDHSDGYTVHGAHLVVQARTKTPVHPSYLGHVFKDAREAAGLPAGVTLHTLRHTFASMLIAQGTQPRVIQERMGHGSIVITMDTYGHLFPVEDNKTRDAIDTALSGLTW
ncbi:site-specific integrase [Actinomadura sp. PM05-2]|uniref:Site-specific integrase n=2 Tax=Actinomadura parmotrematis TaxID=2864039 RepID=A0ABS7G1V8_9ACTN|nr:site-specific integrase [Actinomadura parmotrematis]